MLDEGITLKTRGEEEVNRREEAEGRRRSRRGLFHCASGAAVATSGGGGGAAGGGGDDGSSGIAREEPSEKEIERAVEGRQRYASVGEREKSRMTVTRMAIR
ncbi:hypothetical protein HZH66_013136 [Vespula vulgaris]|uniref:Uncharacterized protein n=1 Tax=Vespula vulgaris TaxID=7454 RepID=A0A834J6L6_VESVU|nr:hypothetical protein HZH66_013136 [Vespula vulgaris]